jgi:hypothetical protein
VHFTGCKLDKTYVQVADLPAMMMDSIRYDGYVFLLPRQEIRFSLDLVE